MRLRAHILIDIDAADFVEAAEHQQRVDDVLQQVRSSYAQAKLEFRRRRDAQIRTWTPDTERAPLHYTGRMAEYED